MFGDIFLPRLNEKLVVLGIAVIIRQKVAESSPIAGGDASGLGSTSSLCGAGEWEKEKDSEAVNPVQETFTEEQLLRDTDTRITADTSMS